MCGVVETISFVARDLERVIEFNFVTLRTKNKGWLRIQIDKKKGEVELRIDREAFRFNYFEFRDFLAFLYKYWEDVKQKYLHKFEKTVKTPKED